MVGGIHAGVYLCDSSGGIDHEAVAGRKLHDTKICEGAVSGSRLMVGVGKELEVEAFFRAELFVRVDVVEAHSENDSVPFGVFGLIHLKLVGFTRSTGGLVFRIEIEDDPLATIVF